MTEPTAKKKSGYAKVVSPVGRVSFPHLTAPDTGRQYSDNKYKADFLFDKSTDLKPLKEACLKAAREVWPKVDPKQIKLPIRDGDKKVTKDGEVINGYANAWYISAKTKTKPGLCNRAKQPLGEGEEVYGGCYARASLTAATYEKEVVVMDEKTGDTQTKRIPAVTFYLNAVQFVKDGPRLGGVSGGVDDFGDDDLGPIDDADVGLGGDEDVSW